MRAIFFALMFLSHGIAYGETCISDEEGRVERSKSLLSKVEFSSDISGSEIDVILSFPVQIEGLRLSEITLAKVGHETGEMEFIFPLKTTLESGKVQAWYMISENMAGNNVVQAAYGNPCGLLVEYQLNYKLEKLKPQ